MLKQLSCPVPNEHFCLSEVFFSNGQARSSVLSKGVSLLASFVGSLQPSVTRRIVRRFLGSSWSAPAIDASCSHLLQVSFKLKQPTMPVLFRCSENVWRHLLKHFTNHAVSHDAECAFHGKDGIPKGNS